MTAPLKFALVPVEPIERPSFCDRGKSRRCCWDNSGAKFCQADRAQSERDASPGNDLLERIVTELNNAHALALNTGYRQSADRIHALLNEIGGGHG